MRVAFEDDPHIVFCGERGFFGNFVQGQVGGDQQLFDAFDFGAVGFLDGGSVERLFEAPLQNAQRKACGGGHRMDINPLVDV